MSLEIILRTCDTANVHNDWRKRYCEFDKSTLIKGCVSSLIKSCSQVDDINIRVFDDHSTAGTVDFLKSLLEDSKIPYSFESLTDQGHNNSALKQFLACRNSSADLVYSIEDDYLHCPTAIQEMLGSYKLFKDRLGDKRIVLYPFDAPEEYNPPAYQSFIVHGSDRHWRTGMFSTCVMMTTPEVFQSFWHWFELMATKYDGDYSKPKPERYEESNTIWNIWRQGHALRFNPLPSLALHMQFEAQIDPFINWQQWWNDYT